MRFTTENNCGCRRKAGSPPSNQYSSTEEPQAISTIDASPQPRPINTQNDRSTAVDRLHSGWRLHTQEVPMLDEQLVQQLQQGHREAFTTLVSKWQHKIYTFCYRQLGEQALSEEATQDVFVKVFTSIQSFRGDAKFSTWLYRIATNHCINLRAKYHRRKRQHHDSFEDVEQRIGVTENPLDKLETQDFEQQLQQALDQLPEEHRLLLILRDIQDCTYEEIADITNLTMGTIKSRIHRARKNLRTILERGDHE